MAAAEEAGPEAVGVAGAMAEMVGSMDAAGKVVAAESTDAVGAVGATVQVAEGMDAVGAVGVAIGVAMVVSAQHRHAHSLAAYVCGMAAEAPCLHIQL